jgi:hypothetical protein
MSTSSSSDTSATSSQETTLSKAEATLLAVFRKFRVGQGEMLCFFGPTLDKHRRALASLTDQGMLVKERFRGGYALTPTGFAAMLGRDPFSSPARRGNVASREKPFEDRRPTSARR